MIMGKKIAITHIQPFIEVIDLCHGKEVLSYERGLDWNSFLRVMKDR
jgi:hypothetical protein